MKPVLVRSALALLLGLIAPQTASATGNDNPTGVTGQFNGSITTAGSYDPYTGNATRTVEDINVTGAVGAYPLKWSRTVNTRNVTAPKNMGRGGWTHSYSWSIYLRAHINPDHWNDETPDYHEGPDAIVYYPDGRQVQFWGGPAGSNYAGAPALDTSVVLRAVGGGNYDLEMEDGGKVQFEWRPDGTGGQSALRARRIVDPHGLITTLSHDTAGRLWRITEPAGRYLQLEYTNNLITKVEAFAWEGNLTQTVTYEYNTGVYYSEATLKRVNYDDSRFALYTYQESNQDGNYAPLIRTCDDVRYAGPMKKIEYVYMPKGMGVDFGQIRGEKYPGSSTLVSQVSYPAWNCCAVGDDEPRYRRTETRADGETRRFQYAVGSGQLLSYSDFKDKWSTTARVSETGNPLFRRVNTDARQNATIIEKEGTGKPIRIYNPPEPGQAATCQTFAYYSVNGVPLYLQIHGDELGRNTYYTRDPNNHRVTKIWYGFNPNDHNAYPTEEFTYNAFGQVETHKLTSGGTENFLYDGRGLKYQSWPPATQSDPNPQDHPTRYFYYTSGPNTDRLWKVVDPRNHETTYEYNLRGQVTKVTHHDGKYKQSDYNPDGTLAWSADENHPNASWNVNERTRYIYDEYKRVLTVTNPLNETTTNVYAPWNGAGSLSHTTSSVYQTISPLGKQVHYDYDPNFRRTITRAAPDTADDAWTFFEYDEAGNLTKTTDPRWKDTVCGYDNRNRKIWMDNAIASDRNSSGHTFNWGYDAVGNKIRETRADDAFRTWVYEPVIPLNRLWKAEEWRTNETATANQTTTYTRHPTGTVQWTTDTKGAVYTFYFDAMNRKAQTWYPPDAAGVTRYESWYYDFAGNLSRHDNPATEVQIFVHDERNRQTESYWWGYSGQHISTRYDAASRVTSITTKRAEVFETSIAFGYDEANRKIWEEQTLAGYPPRQVWTRRDADGNRSEVGVPGYYWFFYDYTQRNQLRNIYGGDWGLLFKYTYDAAGNRLKLQGQWFGNSTNAQYDELNRPTMWEQTMAGDVPYARTWHKYDKVGREVARWRDEQSSKGEHFGYHVANHLTSVAYNADNVWTGNPSNWSSRRDYDYTLDLLNRTSVSGAAYVMQNGMNQYTSVGGQGLDYDHRFNLKTYEGATFTHDAQNKLTSANQNSAQFIYDGLGRCVKRTINGVTRLFVYDEWNPIVEFDGAGNPTHWNLYGTRADEIVMRSHNWYEHLWYQSDPHGNVFTILNDSGGIVEKYTYDAFGQPTITAWNPWPSNDIRVTSAVGNRFMFTGREYIKELGIYDYRNRMYHPGLGRFLQIDRIGLQNEGDKLTPEQKALYLGVAPPDTFSNSELNLYRYCHDDPINKTDPMGLAPDVETPDWVANGLASVGRAIAAQLQSAYREDPVGFVVTAATMGRGRGLHIPGRLKLPAEKISAPPTKPGKAPTGQDGHPVEIHHEGGKAKGPFREMTRSDHRLGDNYKKNHPDNKPSEIDRKAFDQQRKEYWEEELKKDRFGK